MVDFQPMTSGTDLMLMYPTSVRVQTGVMQLVVGGLKTMLFGGRKIAH